MVEEKFTEMLSGGHPNSLGRTIEVVDSVFANSDKLEELYQCYFSDDEVVRLRTSNAMKRISREKPKWLIPYIDNFIAVIATIEQASTQWTLANLFATLASHMSAEQIKKAEDIMKKNLTSHNDWIVLNMTMQTLADWALIDAKLKKWLIPHLDRLSTDARKSVSNRAKKLLKSLS